MAMVVPTGGRGLREAETAMLSEAGAESTVAMYLANFGVTTTWLSALGTDPLGDRILDAITATGVDTSLVRRDPLHRTGLYLKDPGEHATTVYYYRDHSAASTLGIADIEALAYSDFDLIHTSGVTAGLSQSTAELVSHVLDRAEAYETLTSFDVNYRAGLWSVETAAPRLLDLARRADIVLVGLDEAERLWGAGSPEQIAELFPTRKLQRIVVKDSHIGATEICGKKSTFEPALEVEVLEPVGAGDAFAAGYLGALLHGDDAHASLLSGHRTAAWTLGVMSDYRPLRTDTMRRREAEVPRW